MKILAIGAHPDDLEIFAYGTLAAWAEMGANLVLAVASDGAKGGTHPPDELRKVRAVETVAALAPLGLPRLMGFPDGGLRADAPLEDALRGLIAEVQPDLLLTHAPNDYHADHRALSMAASQAAGFTVPVLWMDTLNGTGFVPTHWVDVTAHWGAKETAIRAHASQDPERFVLTAIRQAGFRAGECNAPVTARAEAYRFEPRFPFADIRALLPPAPMLRPIGLRAVTSV
ncbi:MAG: PIG-L deacetylase family protein [Pseudotabrizicola sp.]|uniref:PIG-L deacetylase family protein n=1 Tax=Pseudotabrizicola sp. TaxID=2939647 RepID=UPI00272550B8|nr:PIG-L deacetylase family protein [Pseudotabrizicola sp.]MDO8884720.1 PIG-L deacetylase family protein [Pseudotabrizicola sp.]MDP2080387.1 PIG-L deacetylase family protein [Pseudotabrizicola sp.]MDZ7573769.1 PIG-L deacetylase family protein [Pseudotabrizicola sp.]